MMHPMRTTVTLDPDVESLIQQFMREKGLTFKQAVNASIRAGLAATGGAEFRQQTFAMGSRPEVNYDRALHIAAALETEELVRNLARGA
jgi:hypothetical protein